MSQSRTLPATRRRPVIPKSPHSAAALPLPLFLRAPYIGLLWGIALLTVVTGFTLGRVRLPRVASGVAVAVRSAPDSLALLLLLPPSARPYLRPGQHTAIDPGDDGTPGFTVAIDRVEPALLDAPSARRRFPHAASLLVHLDGPKLAAWLTRCEEPGTQTGTALHDPPATSGPCLTLEPGASYPAVATLGTRSLASYAMPKP